LPAGNLEEIPVENLADQKAHQMRGILRFLADGAAATSIEYALIASSISIAILGVVTSLGATVLHMYTIVGAALK
jgi:Flp pilus assembly pilin Flp